MATMTTVPVALDKATVTRALEKLGADRVMRGHVALEHGTGGNWGGCFLALCYGAFGQLQKIVLRAAPGYEDYDVASVLGLTTAETWAVVSAFDHNRAELQVLVEEWLELNYVRGDSSSIRQVALLAGPSR